MQRNVCRHCFPVVFLQVCAMLRRESELRGHPTTQRALDDITINQETYQSVADQRTIDDEQYEMIFRRVARMKSGELKSHLRQLGLNAKGSTATVRYVRTLHACS
jgi:hypothetical protein